MAKMVWLTTQVESTVRTDVKKLARLTGRKMGPLINDLLKAGVQVEMEERESQEKEGQE